MLLDYATDPARRATPDPEGVQVAGLLNLKKLMEYIGQPMTQRTATDIKRGVKAAPEQFYREYGLFADPRGNVAKDTGPTYVGRPLPEYKSLRALVEEGNTLRDYLQGTEIGDIFANDLANIKVGVTDLPKNYGAGYTAPQGFRKDNGEYRLLQPGFVVVNRTVGPDDVGPMFEHEMQHVYQGLLDMPRGTNLDEMSGPMVEYLQETGNLRPAQLARIDAAAQTQGSSVPYMRYAASTGEAEARAAEARYRGMARGYDVGAPRVEEYLWTHAGPELKQNMLFDIPQQAQSGFDAWWQQKWRK